MNSTANLQQHSARFGYTFNSVSTFVVHMIWNLDSRQDDRLEPGRDRREIQIGSDIPHRHRNRRIEPGDMRFGVPQEWYRRFRELCI
jgi:hypothetical protein